MQAQEDNEMNLVEGELIEQIEQLDEGWWSGVGAGGTKQGLFPGTFVPYTSKYACALTDAMRQRTTSRLSSRRPRLRPLHRRLPRPRLLL